MNPRPRTQFQWHNLPLAAVTVAHAAITLAMAGIIWFVQVVLYPLFGRAGEGRFAAFAQGWNPAAAAHIASMMALNAPLGRIAREHFSGSGR